MKEKAKSSLMRWLPVLVCVTGMTAVSFFWLREYRQSAFTHISAFSEMLIEKYPEAERQVLSAAKEYSALTESEPAGNTFLAQYGYRSDAFCRGLSRGFFASFFVLLGIITGSYFLAIRYMDKRRDSRIAELTAYLEQVNAGTGKVMVQEKEDAFSCLWDELYKTVTKLYQTRETAVQAKKNFADSLADIAHQLKTPIAAASLSLQLMEQETPTVHTGRLKTQLERLNRLEEALLTLSKVDAGTLQLEHKRLDLYTALSLAAENLSGLLQEKEVWVSIPDRGCVEILGDLEWTMEALLNLLKNCMEHSPQGAVIHCDYGGNPLYAEITIWDEGEGFYPEDLPHLFERFYRGKGAAGDGIGIGLALAQSVFALQNGTVTARNLPDGGACFEIRIYSH